MVFVPATSNLQVAAVAPAPPAAPTNHIGSQFLSEDGRDWALEFHAHIAATGKRLEGIDMVRVDEDGKIIEFAVLARPPNAVAALKDEMMRRVPPRLAALKVKQAASALNPFA